MGLLVLSACGGDAGDAADPTTTTEAEVTTTGAAEETSTTEASTTTAAGTDRTSCNESGGSSPAAFDDAAGTYAATITGHDSAALGFDVVQWLVGDDAVEAYHLETLGDPDGPPNDYFVVNENDQVRTAPVADDATVWLVRLADTGNADLKPAAVATWRATSSRAASTGSPSTRDRSPTSASSTSRSALMATGAMRPERQLLLAHPRPRW